MKATIPIDLPRPRPLSMKQQTALLAYVDEIWRLIEEDMKPGGTPRRAGR